MNIKKSVFVPVALAALSVVAAAQSRVPRGTEIPVRTDQRIDIERSSSGELFRGTVARDVRSRDGRVAIPRGSVAELTVRDLGHGDMSLDLNSVVVRGQRYVVDSEDQVYDTDRSGVGKNERTAKYVGGGALLGTIIGAIAGGGKGAAIGAGIGAAGGAGTQIMTRGKEIRVPAESLLTFRLERGLRIGDRGDSDRYRDRR